MFPETFQALQTIQRKLHFGIAISYRFLVEYRRQILSIDVLTYLVFAVHIYACHLRAYAGTP